MPRAHTLHTWSLQRSNSILDLCIDLCKITHDTEVLVEARPEALRYVCEEAINILQLDSICLWLKGQQELNSEMVVTKLP
ncbi:hypothetical protein, partial [Undibacterium sp.]|uniref:hypothetical protein n=1 Tax=Undibacterium sp. TaxID=1914977 RepID=UPI0037521D54